jgi:tetratricopeptide (TPR) repeat protein
MRDVAYDSTSHGRRRLLHRRTAEAIRLNRSASGRDERARFALLASHEQRAGRAAEAAAAYLRAADEAEAVFANREAVEHLESAIALGYPGAAEAHARVGELRARLGEYPAAIGALETAAALADPAGVPAIEIALGRVHRRRGDLQVAASHVAAALASPGLTDQARARGLVESSLIALRLGDLDAANEAALEARDAAATLDDPHQSGVAERLLGLVARARHDFVEARAALERSVTLARDDPDPTAVIAAATALAITIAAAGAVDEALEASQTALEACRRIGDRHLEAAVENHVADILHDAGRPDDSMVHLKRAVALFAEIGEGEPQPDPGIWALAAW